MIHDTGDADLDHLLEIDEEINKENLEDYSVTNDKIEDRGNKRPFERTDVDSEWEPRPGHLTSANHPDDKAFHSAPNETTLAKRVRAPDLGKQMADTVCQPAPKQTTLLKRIPLEGDYVSVTYDSGCRYYLKVTELEEHVDLSQMPYQPVGLANEAERLMTKKASKLLDADHSMRALTSSFSQLWTQRYAPAHYLDLISDETTNRTLLRWLKAWDPYVFGTTPITQPRIPAQPANNPASSGANQFVARADDLENLAGEIDPRDGLPRFRLVLLAGCPGLGKTTLAHLLAEHAGYQVIEINASDDRTSSAFKDQLNAVVTSATSLNRTGQGTTGSFKPCCLILDEIDGAAPAAVELLASAAKTVLQPARERRTRRRNKEPLVLRRPVICICNDLFATAIRPLRASGVPCLVLRLPVVDLGRLISRLDAIAQKENLPVDKAVLTRLAEIADRDVRSCLNAMQFLKSRLSQSSENHAESSVSLADLATLVSMGGGLKDVQRTLFDVWKAVFTIPSTHILSARIQRRGERQGRWMYPTCGPSATAPNRTRPADSESTLSARLEHVMDIANSCGDSQMVAMGIFENYLNSRMKDASLNVARQASEWFVYHDRLFKHIHSRMDFSLYGYPVWLPGWFHLAFATPTGMSLPSATAAGSGSKSLRWPTAHTEAASSRAQCTAILEQLLANQWNSPGLLTASGGTQSEPVRVKSGSFRFLTRRNFLLDVASPVLNIITLMATTLRPLNSQLYSQQEKACLQNLVDLMLNLGVDWSAQQSAETGEMEFQLEPALNSVACFSNSVAALKVIPHTTKQLITRELGLERMRRSERSFQSGAPSAVGSPNRVESRQTKSKIDLTTHTTLKIPGISDVMNKKQRIKRDFFGRPIEEMPKTCKPANPVKGNRYSPLF
ncbi:unnamed protein product [Calicophoron daubneyi]|uniref:AAA+ ATPase domain-containing protein n=1 Tax=Calicophoron daubneyi TaxID=300641 RepID=A0AAV2T2N3_CALDB